MVLTTKLYTAEDLWAMPGDEPWELWQGELRTVPSAGGEASGIAMIIGSILVGFARKLGWITGADGTYVLSRNPDTTVVPDVAFTRWDRLPDGKAPRKYIPVAPDLAVEVQSPSDEPGDMAEKRRLYVRFGVPLVWWIDPVKRTATVYPLGREPFVLTETDVLDGGEVLPGLRIPVAEIFG